MTLVVCEFVVTVVIVVSGLRQAVKRNFTDGADRQHHEHDVDHQHDTEHNLATQRAAAGRQMKDNRFVIASKLTSSSWLAS